MRRIITISLLLGAAWAAGARTLADIQAVANSGHLAEAIAQLKQFTAANPDDTQAMFYRGVLLAENGRQDDAIEVFKSLTTNHPELPEPHNNLAVLYAARGEYVKARDALLVAINTHPSYATAHENLGDIYAKMAGIAYDQALQLDDANAVAKAKLALVRNLFSVTRQTVPASGSPQRVAATPTAMTPAPPVAEPVSPVEPTAAVSGASMATDLPAEVLATVHAWAGAWSAREAEFYLSFYGRDFRAADGRSRRAWERLRRKRLRKPKFIEVTISDANVKLRDSHHAQVTFVQQYRSDTFSDRVAKALELARGESGWKIVTERSIK